MMDRKVIEASEGMYLTNGTTYGKKIYLADDMNEAEFYEISAEKYEDMLEEQRENESFTTMEVIE